MRRLLYSPERHRRLEEVKHDADSKERRTESDIQESRENKDTDLTLLGNVPEMAHNVAGSPDCARLLTTIAA